MRRMFDDGPLASALEIEQIDIAIPNILRGPGIEN